LGILLRTLRKPGSFTSAVDSQARVFACTDYYNQTTAKPFKLIYQSKALTFKKEMKEEYLRLSSGSYAKGHLRI
jgi:hypothetical protein